VLIPWPNRLQDGSYEFDGRRYQLPLNEPERRNAIHGLVRWATWTAAEREPHRAVMKHVLYRNQCRICTIGKRSPGADNGHKPWRGPMSLWERRSSVSSAWDRIHRSLDIACSWAISPAIRRARASRRCGNRGGHRIRFPTAEADRLDAARPCVHRP